MPCTWPGLGRASGIDGVQGEAAGIGKNPNVGRGLFRVSEGGGGHLIRTQRRTLRSQVWVLWFIAGAAVPQGARFSV